MYIYTQINLFIKQTKFFTYTTRSNNFLTQMKYIVIKKNNFFSMLLLSVLFTQIKHFVKQRTVLYSMQLTPIFLYQNQAF